MKLASIAANGQKGVSHLPDNLEQTLQNLHTIILADLQQVGQLVAQVHSESISSCLHDHFPASGEPRDSRRWSRLHWIGFVAFLRPQPSAQARSVKARTERRNWTEL